MFEIAGRFKSTLWNIYLTEKYSFFSNLVSFYSLLELYIIIFYHTALSCRFMNLNINLHLSI